MTQTWLDLPPDTGFGIANLPYGVFSRAAGGPRKVGVAIGDGVLDVAAIATLLGEDFAELFDADALNPLMAAGRPTWQRVRERLTTWLTDATYQPVVLAHRLPRERLELHLPFQVADYVDFYSSEHHARNVGRIFRPESDALRENWKHLPIGYHGRAGTVMVSGSPVIRPRGQLGTGEDGPLFGATRKLDVEAEVGFVVGTPTVYGESIRADDWREHVFGVCLVNDWSARDIQSWETVPLGPFLGKSFATSISPWVVPLDALGAAWVAPREHETPPQRYLRTSADTGLDIAIEVRLNGHLISHPPFASMYWTAAQQLAHLTVNGSSVRTGDLYASGTVSGPEPDERGSLLELTWDGTDPLLLRDGTHRSYLNDGDEIVISATAPGPDGAVISFGEVAGRVLPSVADPEV